LVEVIAAVAQHGYAAWDQLPAAFAIVSWRRIRLSGLDGWYPLLALPTGIFAATR